MVSRGEEGCGRVFQFWLAVSASSLIVFWLRTEMRMDLQLARNMDNHTGHANPSEEHHTYFSLSSRTSRRVCVSLVAHTAPSCLLTSQKSTIIACSDCQSWTSSTVDVRISREIQEGDVVEKKDWRDLSCALYPKNQDPATTRPGRTESKSLWQPKRSTIIVLDSRCRVQVSYNIGIISASNMRGLHYFRI